MALDRLKSVAQHVTGSANPPHPFDPLSSQEIETAVSIIRAEHGKLHYNAVTLQEPRKAEMLKWLEDTSKPRPMRIADIVAVIPGGKVCDVLVNLQTAKIVKWEVIEGVQPLVSHAFPCSTRKSSCTNARQITMEDLNQVEAVVRKDPKVIQQCIISGVPADEMDKVYCDRKLNKSWPKF